MTKPVSRKMAVDALLYCFSQGDCADGIVFAVIENGGGVVLLCPECREPILPGQQIQFDHRHAIVHGGPHEYQNLRPVHYDPCHKKKSARDVKANAKVKRLRGETKGRPKRAWPTRKMKSAKKPWPKRKMGGKR